MKNIDFKSLLIGIFATITLSLSINATPVENNQYGSGDQYKVTIGYYDYIDVPGDGIYLFKTGKAGALTKQ